MTPLRAIYRQYTGPRDVHLDDVEVDILGFTYGRHQNGNGPARFAEVALAVIAMPGGTLKAAPLHELTLVRGAQ